MVSFFKDKNFIWLILLTLGVYAHTLFFDFVGDDDALFVKNTFYSSASNIRRVFEPSYSVDNAVLTNTKMFVSDKGSGSVAYRPVVTLSFFLDSYLWGKNPAGYHLANVILHIVNVLMVYALFSILCRIPFLAFLGAAIFSVHPVQSEAVAAIGFRSDLLVLFWLLISVHGWIRSFKDSKFWYLISWASYGCALFSKEAAIFLPLMLLLLSRIQNIALRDSLRRLIPYLLFAVFYLYVYIFVFTNRAGGALFGGDVLSWAALYGDIFLKYLIYLFVPFLVMPWPFMYRPEISVQGWFAFIAVCLFLFGAGAKILLSKSNRDSLVISGVWVLVFFLPVAGIISNPNPLALRYFYAPMVGLGFLLAYLIYIFSRWLQKKIPNVHWFRLLATLFLGCCMIYSVAAGMIWKSQDVYANSMLVNYSNSAGGHNMLGSVLMKEGRLKEAIAQFNQALDDPLMEDPNPIFMLGMSYFFDHQYLKAGKVFFGLTQIMPRYSRGYYGLAVLFYSKGYYSLAEKASRRAIILGGHPSDYDLLFRLMLDTGRKEEISSELEQARRLFDGNPEFVHFIDDRARQLLKDGVIGIDERSFSQELFRAYFKKVE